MHKSHKYGTNGTFFLLECLHELATTCLTGKKGQKVPLAP